MNSVSLARYRIRDQLMSQVWHKVRSQAGYQVLFHARDQVWGQVSDDVWHHVRGQVRVQAVEDV